MRYVKPCKLIVVLILSVTFTGKFVTELLNDYWKVLVISFLQPFVDKAMENGLGYLHKFFEILHYR